MSTDSPSGTVSGGTATAAPLTSSSYSVNFQVDYPASTSRLFAVPILGIVIRLILLIPHLIVIYILQILAEIVFIVAWIPVLFTGKYPEGLYSLVSGFIRWYARVYAYLFGLTDKYPPFSLGDEPSYPVHVTIEQPAQSSRFFAIPIIGGVVRIVLLIPHLIILYIMFAISFLFNLVAWIPALFAGTYPRWQYSFQSGLIRYGTRVFAYLFGLTDKYPPFGMGA
jgi:hypothetical protein